MTHAMTRRPDRRLLVAVALAGVVVGACGSSTPPAASSTIDVAGGGKPTGTGPVVSATSSPAPSADPGTALRTPRVALPPGPALLPPAYASRVSVPELGIDLPVISGDLQPPPNYPLCDVAAYVTRFSQPYEPGITYISAHAQEGMFLRLLVASQRDDGQSLLGLRVDVYTDAGVRYGYAIDRVNRHATDYAIIDDLDLSARSLILQTSEGPYGTTEKLQVVASPVDEADVPAAEAVPPAMPRDCRPRELIGDRTPAPSATPSNGPVVVSAPTPAAAPSASPSPSTPAPTETRAPGQSLVPDAVATRVVMPSLGIDLPVVSGDLRPPPNYPLCDVASYVTFLAQPGELGTIYITAHAQEGMFLPILTASEYNDGRSMLGATVHVYSSDAQRYTYEIWQVWRHITDRSIASDGLQPSERRLVLQTSEGPFGTVEKLGIVGSLSDVSPADPAEANPVSEPRDCTPAGFDSRD